MKNIRYFTAVFLILGFFGPGFSYAQETTSVEDLIALLQQQIDDLKAQIAELQTKLGPLKSTERQAVRFTKQLRRGVKNQEVTNLQEFLSQFPDIYPEALVTGFFGPLTESAVKRFQKKHGIEQAGEVGPKTRFRINELLTEGAGKSGKIPPGLLRAPGIQKKLATTTPPEGDDDDDDGDDVDTTAPVISGVSAVDIATSSASIIWDTDEMADSKVNYALTSPVSTATTTDVSADTDVESHSIGLTGLSASTTYYYIVESSDPSGNTSTSSEQSFGTL